MTPDPNSGYFRILNIFCPDWHPGKQILGLIRTKPSLLLPGVLGLTGHALAWAVKKKKKKKNRNSISKFLKLWVYRKFSCCHAEILTKKSWKFYGMCKLFSRPVNSIGSDLIRITTSGSILFLLCSNRLLHLAMEPKLFGVILRQWSLQICEHGGTGNTIRFHV